MRRALLPAILLLCSITAFAEAPPGAAEAEACAASSEARFITGDQVFLRQEPATTGAIEAALPWGTCARQLDALTEWTLVEVAGQQGFISSRFLSAAPPARRALPADAGGRICAGAWPSDRDVHVYPAPYCEGMPTEAPDWFTLGGLERSDAESLAVRFATWTLALASQSAYLAHTSAGLLNESPLFRPVPRQARNPFGAGERPPASARAFRALFGIEDTRPLAPPPDSVYLLPVSPDDTGLRFQGTQSFGDLGVGDSGFPAGRFRLSDDKRTVYFERPLPAVALDPCSEAFLPVTLEVSYVPGTGRFGARIDEPTRARLDACRRSLPLEEYPFVRFLVVVDESPESTLLASLARAPDAARSAGVSWSQNSEQPWAREWVWLDGASRATLRAEITEEANVHAIMSLELDDGTQRARLQYSLWTP